MPAGGRQACLFFGIAACPDHPPAAGTKKKSGCSQPDLLHFN